MDVVRMLTDALPLVMANELGWEIRCDREVRAHWNGGYLPKDMKIIAGKEAADSHFGYGILTFHHVLSIPDAARREPSGHGPVNRPRKNVVPLEGLIEADSSHMTCTMNWMVWKNDGHLQ